MALISLRGQWRGSDTIYKLVGIEAPAIFQLQFADFIARRRVARNFSVPMLSRGNDCKAQLSAILPIDRDRKRGRECARDREGGRGGESEQERK